VVKTVVISGVPLHVAREDWREVLEELKRFIESRRVVSCRKLLYGLYVLEQIAWRPEVYRLYVEVDRLVAEAVRQGACTDLVAEEAGEDAVGLGRRGIQDNNFGSGW